MINKNNAYLRKILPILKVSNWLIKKGLLIYFTILCILSFEGNLRSLIHPEPNVSLDICVGEQAWILIAVYFVCFIIWGFLLGWTWWRKTTWKSLLPHILIFFLIKYAFIITESIVFGICSD